MNPLQNLKDIRTPAAIESWPPAYGWWVLAALVLFGIVMLIIGIVKFRKVRVAKRQALQALQQIDGSTQNSASQLNQLLKRVAMSYFPQQNVQAMHSEKWAEFLLKTLPKNKSKDTFQSFELMQQSLYQPHTSENSDFQRNYKSVERWIKQALPPRKGTIHQLEQNNA